MLKKVSILICITLLCLLLNLNQNLIVSASSDTTIIESDITISHETIEISPTVSVLFDIKSGATLTLEDVTFSILGTNKLSKIFNVEEGAKLIIKGADLSSVKATYGIYSKGAVELDCVTFGTNSTTNICNDSIQQDSLIFHNVLINNVYLKRGYITLVEDSAINENSSTIVNVKLDNEYIGKLVVKGQNTLASYYIDKFKYIGNFSETNQFGEILPGLLDYVGDRPENVSFETYEFDSGDIILTTQSIYKGTATNHTYFATKYGTGRIYLKTNNTSSVFIKGSNFPVEIPLNNYSYLSGTFSILKTEPTNELKIRINHRLENGEIIGTKQINMSSNTSRAIFINIPNGYEFESIVSQSSLIAVGPSARINRSSLLAVNLTAARISSYFEKAFVGGHKILLMLFALSNKLLP